MLVGLMALAVRFAADATGSGDGSAAKVGQVQHLLEDGATLLFQIDEGLGHGLCPPIEYAELSLRTNTLGY